MGKFTNKTVIVTGGNSGIGEAAAVEFAEEGANVAIMARNEETGKAVVEKIHCLGGVAKFYKVDVSVKEQIQQAHLDVINDFGPYHAAFNNSGISGGAKLLHEMTTDDFDSLMKTNTYSVFWCMREQLRNFVDNNIPGAIVNCASVAGVLGRLYMAGYVSSKHAVVGLTRAAALDYAARGIRVNALCPGATETPTLNQYLDLVPAEEKAAIERSIPRGRMGTTIELASLAVWLCTDKAANVIGQAFVSDGGITAM